MRWEMAYERTLSRQDAKEWGSLRQFLGPGMVRLAAPGIGGLYNKLYHAHQRGAVRLRAHSTGGVKVRSKST